MISAIVVAIWIAGCVPVDSIGAQMHIPVSIPAAVWKDELPFSPKLADFASGLALAAGAGERNGAAAPVAAIRFRMPDNVVRRYRGRVDPAIFVVAVAEGSGAVYAAACVGQDAPPATFDPAAAPDSVRGQPAVGGIVNVDIVAQLGLPPNAGRYLVFAWLDEWVSAAATIDVAADPRRVDSPLKVAPNPAGAVRVTAAPGGTAPVSVSASGSGRVQASWNAAAASPVVVLGYDLEQRSIRWEIAADAKAPQAKAGSAEITTASFVGASRPGPSAIAVLAAGQVRSALSAR
jgi:hypothetical protein